jgi:hypothetical protein
MTGAMYKRSSCSYSSLEELRQTCSCSLQIFNLTGTFNDIFVVDTRTRYGSCPKHSLSLLVNSDDSSPILISL